MIRDWDTFFAYSTPRLVKIRDWRLGVFNYFLYFLCCLYAFYYLIADRTMYDIPIPVSGLSHISLNFDFESPADFSKKAYCAQAKENSPNMKQQQCVLPPPHLVDQWREKKSFVHIHTSSFGNDNSGL